VGGHVARKRVWMGGLLLAQATLVALTMLPNQSAQAGTASGVSFGAYAPPAPESGMQAVTDLEAALGTKSLDIVHWFQAWGDGQHGQFHAAWFDDVGARTALLTWEPWVPGKGTSQRKYRLRRIANGAWDTYIRSWAQGIKGLNRTVYVRPMHEMNGNWYPWSGVTNGNTPADYIRAWRHIVDLFRQEAVTNVRWVWTPNVTDVPASNDLELYWPGSTYVDVIGLDGFNWGACVPANGGWKSFDSVFQSAYARVSALGAQDIWIPETASTPLGGDKTAWVRQMFDSLPVNFPRVKALVWFHTNKECDWRLTSPPDAATTAGSYLV
jgi:beta-mannanase